MKVLKKIIACVTLFALAATLFGGCGKDVASNSGEDIPKLTYWAGNSASKYVKNYDEVYSLQKIQEKIGIDIEFIHPTSSSWEEQLNIMLASGEYTDMIHQIVWNGGFEQAYKDGIALDLTPYYDSGKMPNFKKAVEKHPGVEAQYKTIDGKLLHVETIKSDPSMNASLGPVVRGDWLKKLNLEIPQDMDDWYNMLVAFRDGDPNGNGEKDEIPFADQRSQYFANFSAAFGVKKAYYMKDGKIVYGSVQPEYKEFIAEMNKWYTEGLIDSEFAAIDKKIVDANVLNNKAGSIIGYIGSHMGNYLNAKKGDPEFDLVGVPWPKTRSGEKYYAQDITAVAGTGGLIVTTSCKNPDLAVKFVDFLFSEEATELLNWGEEGVTYTKENGEYKLTDYVLNNPDGAEPLAASSKYFFGSLAYPPKYWLNESYSQLQYNYPQQKNATKVWAEDASDMLVGTRFKLTAEESSRLAQLKADLNTYESEMFTKMVMGREPLSKFDEYVEKMYELGLDEILSIYEAAHKRYEEIMNK